MGGSKISFPSVNELQRKRATNHRQYTAYTFLGPPFCCSFPLQFISKRGVGIPSVNTRFSLVPPSPPPFLKWVAKEKSNKRGAEKKWIAKKEQQILKISLSPGRQDHGARGKNEKICRDSGNYLNMLRLAWNSELKGFSVSAFICRIPQVPISTLS